MSEPPAWMPITEDQRDGTHYIVGFAVGAVLIVRDAWWDDGTWWDQLGFDRQQELRGWWTQDGEDTRVRLDGPRTPTHWLMRTPTLKG